MYCYMGSRRRSTYRFSDSADKGGQDLQACAPAYNENMTDRKREMVPLSELLEMHAPDNPKDHDIGLLITSLRIFGMIRPLAINEKDRTLLLGHGITEALSIMKEKAWPAPSGIDIRDSDGEWLVPAERGISRPTAKAKAYRIMDNRSTERGGYDAPLLAVQLQDFAEAGEIEATGFDEDDAQRLAEIFSPQGQQAKVRLDELDPPVRISFICPNCGHSFEVREW